MMVLKRRHFLVRLFKGASVSLLSLMPSSIFHDRNLYAQSEEEFEGIFSRTTSSNVYDIVKASRLNNEEKMAIVAARELSRSDIQKAISNISLMGGRVENGGGCGGNCTGQYCGQGCTGGDGSYGICVIDKRSKMNIDIASLDKNRFKRALEKVASLTR
jgi:hypothetical protein